MDKIKKAFGQQDDSNTNESSPLMQISGESSLSWNTRLKYFAGCFVVGVVCSILGTIMLWVKIQLFAAFYTLGNVTSLAGSFFLVGPLKQLKNMFKEKRLIASIIMLASLALTLMAALWWKKKVLALLFCAIQLLAMTWYCISYIPFARDAVKKCVGSCLG